MNSPGRVSARNCRPRPPGNPGLSNQFGDRYSGHGVMLSNYCGKLYADRIAGAAPELDGLEALDVRGFPGGRRFRDPLLFLALTWFALRDRL